MPPINLLVSEASSSLVQEVNEGERRSEMNLNERSNNNNNISVNRRRGEVTFDPVPIPQPQGYDAYFTSSVVSEKKRFLWEIKEFEEILESGVMRAMRFEFEMGRLGSLEKHLPRRSRWRVTLDTVGQDPELTLQLLFPEDKVIFYKFFAQIMDGPQIETDVTTRKDSNSFRFREGSSSRTSVGNRYPLRPEFGDRARGPSVRNYISERSLFVKVEMEIMEDSSTS